MPLGDHNTLLEYQIAIQKFSFKTTRGRMCIQYKLTFSCDHTEDSMLQCEFKNGGLFDLSDNLIPCSQFSQQGRQSCLCSECSESPWILSSRWQELGTIDEKSSKDFPPGFMANEVNSFPEGSRDAEEALTFFDSYGKVPSSETDGSTNNFDTSRTSKLTGESGSISEHPPTPPTAESRYSVKLPSWNSNDEPGSCTTPKAANLATTVLSALEQQRQKLKNLMTPSGALESSIPEPQPLYATEGIDLVPVNGPEGLAILADIRSSYLCMPSERTARQIYDFVLRNRTLLEDVIPSYVSFRHPVSYFYRRSLSTGRELSPGLCSPVVVNDEAFIMRSKFFTTWYKLDWQSIIGSNSTFSEDSDQMSSVTSGNKDKDQEDT